MALSRAFTPAQFRDAFLGVVGPVGATVTIPSTAAGATTENSGISVPGAALGDLVFVIPAVAPTAGCVIAASVTAANTVTIVTTVGTGGTTYNPGAQTLTFFCLRLRTA